MNDATYLGFDLSTQQLKVVITTADLSDVLHWAAVHFDTDLPKFRTKGGVDISDDGLQVTSPVTMWIQAIDLVLQRLQEQNVDFTKISALSGAGQQHGTVYWEKGAEEILKNLDYEKDLYEQLKDAFTVLDSPVWMDSSTKLQCNNLENAVGGALKLSEVTGSRAYERFSGNQIAKIHETTPERLVECERISLVSSFIASIFLGEYAPIDLSDGCGMNLLDITKKEWDPVCLNACAPMLHEKLGNLVPSNSVLGKISSYFAQKYKFKLDCKVVAFTGDNPSSMAGLLMRKGDIAISLGTSDTVFAWVEQATPTLNSHIFCNPIDHNQFMAMLCFKNGAISRENVRINCSCENWDEFNTLLQSTPPANNNNFGFYYDFPEILPDVGPGYHRYTCTGVKVDSFCREVEARAIIEHQCLAKRIFAQELGFKLGGRVIVTGGGSKNESILQIIADVFDAHVFTIHVADSAALGAAYRAKHGTAPNSNWDGICDKGGKFKLSAKPLNAQVYDSLAVQYKESMKILSEDNKK